MDKRKILVLGIGNAQADLIKWCKEYGLEVHACSYTDHGRGKQHVDHFELIDIKNAPQILKYVNAHQIGLIYSIGSDVAMPAIAYVAEHAGLDSFISQHTARICQNKALFRSTLGEDFEYNIPFRKGKDLLDLALWSIYPAIIKPVDSQGQRGISTVYSFEDVKANFHKASEFSPSQEVIIERYLDGDEISINAYIVGKEIKFFYVTDRISYQEFPGGIIKEHLYPSKYSYMEKALKKLVSKTIDKIGLDNGPAYFQVCIYHEKPYIFEVAPRFDGCHLWRLVKMTNGTDLLEITMLHLMEGSVDSAKFNATEETDGKPFRLKFLAQPPSSEVNYGDGKKESDRLFEELYYTEGDIVPKMNGFIEKTGYYIDVLEA